MYTLNIKHVETLRINMPLSIVYLTDTVGIDIEDYMNHIENPAIKFEVSKAQVDLIAKIFGVTQEFITHNEDLVTHSDKQVLDQLHQFQKRAGSAMQSQTASGKVEWLMFLARDTPRIHWFD